MTDTVDIRPIEVRKGHDFSYLNVRLGPDDIPDGSAVTSISIRLPPDGPVFSLALAMGHDVHIGKKGDLVSLEDEFYDISHYGSFSNTPESDLAIEHGSHDSRTFNWFNPNTDAHETPEHAREAYERVMKIERGDIDVVGLIARVSSPTGQLLGDASCWEFEVEWFPPGSVSRGQQDAHLVDALEDLVTEALREAMESYDKLMETVDAVRVLRQAVGLGGVSA